MPAAKNSPLENMSDREIVVSRIFDAPRDLVWHALVDPQQVVQWWGPRGFTTTIHEMDVRPGGVWRHTMHGPDGTDYPNKSEFIEVVKHERIVYSHGGGRKGGRGAHFQATWIFEDLAGKTKLTIRMVFDSVEEREFIAKEYGAIEGGKQTLDRLAERLEMINAESLVGGELVLARSFDAPRSLVYKVWTDPKHLAQWWGPNGFTNPVCEMDLRAGGGIRIHMRASNGTVYPMSGEFREILQFERVVFTSGALDEDGKLLFKFLNTVTFAEQDGKAVLTLHSRLLHSTSKAAQYLGGHKEGWSQSLVRLETYVLSQIERAS